MISPHKILLTLSSLLVISLSATLLAHGGEVIETDVCVYGGAAGGVTAAVEAARLGKTVALLSLINHLGGLSSSGLGATDVGTNGDGYIQGLSREFYTRIGAKYSHPNPTYTFEPHIAETVFNEMVQQAGVSVFLGQHLAGTTMMGGKITQITMANGNVFRAKMFIDASYEGDLLKQAGVTYVTGREANSQYGETLNGIQTSNGGNQLPAGIDPYLVQGNPGSGLLPGVNPTAGGANGSADSKIQAYCYRMCLTTASSNRIMIAKPPGYNEADYELLFRAIEAGQTTSFFTTGGLPNSKSDSNNSSGISTDFIGMNYNYPEADYATRATIAKAHENWQRGFVWTLQNHTRVPQTIRDAYAQFGLAQDEFADNNNWPYDLYVREARRMVSDYVMTEKNCAGVTVSPDPVGLAAYNMDSHNCQRIVLGGFVRNEGDVQRSISSPFPVSYRSLIPKATECTNLLTPWSVSSSHIAFDSIRMEPVFMILGQSAGAAACFAIDDNVAVQNLSYTKLRAQLVSDGQLLATDSGSTSTTITVDNANFSSVVQTGTWTDSTVTTGYYGINYTTDGNSNKGTKSVRFTPSIPISGTNEVFMRWTTNANRATNVPVDIVSTSGTSTVTVNQQLQNGVWVSLGLYPFSSGTQGSVLIRTDNTNGYVIADAVQFVGATGTTALPVVSLWSTDAQAYEFSDATGRAVPGKILISRTGATTAPLTINLNIAGTAINGTTYKTIPGSVTIASGSSAATISVMPQADFRTTGNQTAIVSLAPASAYTTGSLNQATIMIYDQGYDPKANTSWFVQKLQAGLPQKIVGFGTSLTAGGPDSWLTTFTAGLTAAYPGLVTVINSGGSGQNSDWGVANLQSKVIANNPDVVFIEFATNDAVTRFNLSPAHVRANVETLVAQIRSAFPECEIILQVMNPVINSMLADTSQRPFLQRYQQIYRDVASERGLKLIDHMPAWQALLDAGTSGFVTYVPDGLHPNNLGYQKFVAPVILKELGVWNGPNQVIDNTDVSGVSLSGSWTALTTPAGFYGVNCLSDENASKGAKSINFSPSFTVGGNFPVYLRYSSDSTRATNVPVDIVCASGTSTVMINQQQQGGQWVFLGTFPFNTGSSGFVAIRTDFTNGTVVADSVGFDVPSMALPSVSLWTDNGLASESPTSTIPARGSTITVCRSGPTGNSLTVFLSLTGTAINGVDYASLPGSVTIPAGASLATIPFIPTADNLAEGDEAVKISLASNGAYTLGTPAAATITIQDRPMDAWRFNHFTSQQLNSPVYGAVSANPSGDGFSNLAKYALGLDPNPSNGVGAVMQSTINVNGNDYLTLSFTRNDAADVTCSAEVSGDLTGWTSGPSSVKETILMDNGLLQTVTAQDQLPIQTNVRRFIRLRITRLQ